MVWPGLPYHAVNYMTCDCVFMMNLLGPVLVATARYATHIHFWITRPEKWGFKVMA
jgi:hypothetical protein